ncbi:unnamed protein product [Prunus armeniaca]
MLGNQPMAVPEVDVPGLVPEAMMQWQVNRQFRKYRDAAIARIPNPYVVIAEIPERGEIQAGQRGGALPIQEHEAPVQPEGSAPVQVPRNQPEPPPIPQSMAPHDQPLALLPEQPAVLPYRPRTMDPNPFPPLAKGRRDFEEEEEHREEVMTRLYRMEQRIEQNQPEQGRNPHPVNALNDMGALQRIFREMMEPKARRGETPTYRRPYPVYIDQIPLSPGFKSEDEPAQDFITRFRNLKMKCRILMEERHFIQMAQTALKISLRKRFDGMLFGDLAELANKASKYEELLREEQQKRNSSKSTYFKTSSSSVHLVEVESEKGTEGSEEREVAVAEMAKLKHPISCKALTKQPKDQKPPPFTGGFVPNKPTQNKVYSFDLTKVDALFDEMLLQKAIETPHRLPKPEELKGTQYCIWHKCLASSLEDWNRHFVLNLQNTAI